MAVVVLSGAGLARADLFTDTNSNVLFTASVTPTSTGETISLDIQCLNVSVCGNWYLGDVTLKGFSFTGDPTLGPSPTGYTVENGGQDNNAVGSGGGCNGATKAGKGQDGKAVCWDAPSTLGTKLGGSPIVFTANITGTGNPDHIQVTAYDNTSGTENGGTKVLAVSDDLTAGGTTPTPEPASLVMLGSGLLTIGGILRRKLR